MNGRNETFRGKRPHQPPYLVAVVSVAFMIPTATATPTVTNVTAAQRGDLSKRVDIRYDVAADGPCTVWVMVSDNGGTTWNVPAIRFTGSVGQNIAPGAGKIIVWDAAADIPGKMGNFKIRVYADDGVASNMVPVPAGLFPYQHGTPIWVDTFLIDKYEVTNQRYAEFLNAADPNSDHWDSRMEIGRTGELPNVYYIVADGKENYPIRFVNAVDAEAYAAWLSAREGRTYRLPTEQEWEKAAAWNPLLQRHWPYGFQLDRIYCPRCNYNETNGQGYCVGNTSEVGYYNGINNTNDARSFYGCYDLSGNVYELTSSLNGGGPSRIARGGSWGSGGPNCTTEYRFGTMPDERDRYGGFRLVLDPN